MVGMHQKHMRDLYLAVWHADPATEWNMIWWVREDHNHNEGEGGSVCGTACCAAGNYAIANQGRLGRRWWCDEPYGGLAKHFGITEGEATRIFSALAYQTRNAGATARWRVLRRIARTMEAYGAPRPRVRERKPAERQAMAAGRVTVRVATPGTVPARGVRRATAQNARA